MTRFPPTRTAALERLNTFLPKAGKTYAARRNYDLGPDRHDGVSQLSPYIRARLISEAEVVEAVLGRFSPTTAEKFVQEVFWRTYWKGWLEMRPEVWRAYKRALRARLDDVQTQSGLRARWEAACSGETDIACFNGWARELTETGYMHNHARMWFASIWIFTLRLPWELGADFFLRQLLDGDPASNTLSWRWVAGLQTRGKNYVARSANIAKYTEARFGSVAGLALDPAPLDGLPPPDRMPIAPLPPPQTGLPTGYLLHDDDVWPAPLLDVPTRGTFLLNTRTALSPLHVAPHVADFAQGALDDTAARYGERLGPVTTGTTLEAVEAWAKANGIAQILTPDAPVGPNADLLAALAARGWTVSRLRRPYDSAAWPHATAGFFKFKGKIPSLIAQIKGIAAA